MKILSQTTYENGLETVIEVRIYDKKIHWYFSERMQFYEGEDETMIQTLEDYLKNGIPEFAGILSSEKLREIDNIIKEEL